MWGQLILFISSVYCLYLAIFKLDTKKNDIKWVLILALVVWITSLFFNSVDTPQIDIYVAEILHIFTMSLVLTLLLIIVRNLRPAIFRYPYFLVYSPLLIPLFFFLIIDTYLIKTIIIMTTQFIAIFVYLLLIFDENALTHKRSIGIISSVLIILSYCSYWFLIELIPFSDIIWQITLSAGIVTAIYTLSKKLTINHTVLKNESRG